MQKVSSGSVKIFYPEHKLPELVAVLRERVEALVQIFPLRRVVLFGSWARGKQTAFSDIDVLVIYSGLPREDAYKMAKQHLNLRGVEPHVYSEDEAEKLKPTLDRMTRDGIVLYPCNRSLHSTI